MKRAEVVADVVQDPPMPDASKRSRKRRRIGTIERRMGMKSVLASAAALACVALTSSAHAEPPTARGIDWGKLLVQLDHFARTGAESPAATTIGSSGLERNPEPYAQNPGNAWFGVAPRVALVARDWGTAYRLAGDRLSLVDAMRLSSSTRMIVSRVRLSNTRIAPFTQLGLGQWRVDRNLLPLTPRNMELAAQFGGGIEVRVGAWQIACESTLTAIYREVRESNNIPQTKLWSTMFAARAEF